MSKKVKVLHIIDHAIGGISSTLLEYCSTYNKKIYEWHLLILGENIRKKEFKSVKIKVKEIAVTHINLKPINIFKIYMIYKVYKYVKELSPDIIHTHMEKSEFIGSLLPAKVRINTFHYFSKIKQSTYFINKLRTQLHKCLQFRYKKYIAVSKAIEQFYVNFDYIQPTMISQIYNGINLEKFTFYTKSKNLDFIEKDDFVIGFVGRLSPEKGCDVLLKSIKILRNITTQKFKLIIVGDGKERAKLMEYCRYESLDEIVYFLGMQTDVQNLFKLFDISVLPSHTEGLPTSAIESIVCNVPVVASAVGGVPEIIEENYTGFLFKDNDYNNLALILKKLIEKKELVKSLSGNCKKSDFQKFDVKKSIIKLEQLYRECLLETGNKNEKNA